MDPSPQQKVLAYNVVCAIAFLIWAIGTDYALLESVRQNLLSWKSAEMLGYANDAFAVVAVTICLYALNRPYRDTHPDEDGFRLGIETSPSGVALVDADGLLTYANPSFLRIFRLTRAVEGNTSFESFVQPFLENPDWRSFYPAKGDADRFHVLQIGDKAGTSLRLQLRFLPGSVRRWIAIVHPIANDWAASYPDSVSMVLSDIAMDAVLIIDTVDRDYPIVHANAVFQRMTLYSQSEIAGKSYRIIEARDDFVSGSPLRAAVEGGSRTFTTARVLRKDGSSLLCDMHVAPVPHSQAAEGERARYAVAVIRDLTHMRELEADLERSRTYDTITSLPQLGVFQQRLASLLTAMPDGGCIVAIIDVRRFSNINAAHGHDFSNLILIQIGRRLSAMNALLVSRVGFDEFAVVLAVPDASHARAKIAEATTVLEATYIVPGSALTLSFAIGYTVHQTGRDAETLLREAKAAHWRAGDLDLRDPQPFEERIDLAVRQRLALTRDLQAALGQHEFEVVYEPRADLESGRIVGGAASLRWHHPVFGIQEPARFMSIANESGLILRIGAWAVAEIVRCVSAINRNRASPFQVSLQLSHLQLRDRGLMEQLDAVIAGSEARPEWFVIQIPQRFFSGAPEDVSLILAQLRERGFGLGLPDFDTVCANLSRLGSLPVTTMTIDRAYVRGSLGDPHHHVAIRSVVAMCDDKAIACTAEGIDDDRSWELMRSLGCRTGQGRLVSPPLEAEEFTALLKRAEPGSGSHCRGQAVLGTC
eukprot:gene12533-12622_t